MATASHPAMTTTVAARTPRPSAWGVIVESRARRRDHSARERSRAGRRRAIARSWEVVLTMRRVSVTLGACHVPHVG